MCGIGGIIGLDTETARRIAPRMQAALHHRGPDDRGLQEICDPAGDAPPAILLHTRLAILDLTSAGHQPMQDAGNWITFNGEIFNFNELRDDLSRAGLPCTTRCDTEVILKAYRAWGRECVRRFHGQFAWCLLDGTRGQAWLCRDRLGEKPLYLFRPARGGLLVASEVRTLLAAGQEVVPPEISRDAIESFLAQGAVYGRDSIIRGVELLDAGESLVLDWSGREVERRHYWRIPETTYDPMLPRAPVVAELGRRLRDAVRMRLIADVPLGLFLSGGVDSAAIATLATEVAGADVRTISIGFDQADFDESVAAESVARQLGTQHQTIRLRGEDVLRDMDEVLLAVDQPTVDGFNTYFVSRAARRAGLTVALSGLGGDELFGGYASFRDVPRAAAWARHLRAARLLVALLASSGKDRRAAKLRHLMQRGDSMLKLYLLRRELFLPDARRSLHDLARGSDPITGVSQTSLAQLEALAAGLDPVSQISRFELAGYMKHMLLRDADVFGMAHPLEIRPAMLDHRVVELAARSPGAWKRPDPRPKPLLLDAVGARLPRGVYAAPKRGFTFPWGPWLRGPMRSRATNAIGDADVWARLRFNPDAPRRIWEQFLAGDASVSPLQVLGLVVLGDYVRRHDLRSEPT